LSQRRASTCKGVGRTRADIKRGKGFAGGGGLVDDSVFTDGLKEKRVRKGRKDYPLPGNPATGAVDHIGPARCFRGKERKAEKSASDFIFSEDDKMLANHANHLKK